MNIYACLYMFIHIYTYSCIKNFLPSLLQYGIEMQDKKMPSIISTFKH